MDIFQRIGDRTVSISATTTSNNEAISADKAKSQLRVVIGNASGCNFVYLRFGADDTVVATSADIAMLPNSAEIFTIGNGITHVAAITDAGTAVVKLLPGQGG